MGKMLRVSDEIYKKLNQLTNSIGSSKQAVLEIALDDLAKKNLLEQANRAYDKLRQQPKEWKKELEERQQWDSTLADGLEDY